MITAASLVVLLASWAASDLPLWVAQAGAVGLGTTYAAGLAARVGGRPWPIAALAALVGGAAVVSAVPLLLSGAAVLTAVTAAVLATVVTRPAPRLRGAAVELAVAIAVAGGGALAVEGFRAPLQPERTAYLVVVVGLLAALAAAYHVAAGLTGIGPRGALEVAGGAVLVVLVLAYTAALARWGTTGLRDGLDSFGADVRATLGAIPRPSMFLIGFPALFAGSWLRSRRRQGWWVCAFGSVGLAGVTTSLLDPALPAGEAALGIGYSAVLGAALAAGAVRLSVALARPRRRWNPGDGRRAEPGRARPLC